MGWAFCGKNIEGREIGYGVEAKCDQRGCRRRINRGLSYVCGGMHDGGDNGCGRYFCGKHLYFGSFKNEEHGCQQVCKKCLANEDSEE